MEIPRVYNQKYQEEISGVEILEEEYQGMEIPGVDQDIETPGVSNLTEETTKKTMPRNPPGPIPIDVFQPKTDCSLSFSGM